jgi:hypothetical protein
MVLLASGVQVASPKVREKGRGLVRKWARQGVLKRAADVLGHRSSRGSRAEESWPLGLVTIGRWSDAVDMRE